MIQEASTDADGSESRRYKRGTDNLKNIIKSKRVWIPNLFTLGNLSLGFFAILIAFSSKDAPQVLSLSGVLIMLAVLFDGLDGYMARLLNARSSLGAQLDSLADLTTFGIAPGVVMYAMILHRYTYTFTNHFNIPVGMFLAVIFPAFAAYRLARFNVSHDEESFSGLPSPVAGLIVALMPIVFLETVLVPHILLVGIFILVAFLMVSTVKYSKPQVTFLRKFSPIRLAFALALVVGVLVLIFVRYGAGYSAATLFTLIVIYVVSGLVALIIHAIQELRM